MRTLSLLQAAPGGADALNGWLVSEFGPARGAAHGLIVNAATPQPPGLSLYGSREANAGEHYDTVIEGQFDSARSLLAFVDQLRRHAPVDIALHHGYAVEMTNVIHREGFTPGRPTPGYKLLRGLYLHEDLPDAAAKRMWAHHSGLATRVHVGLARYSRHWVDACLTPGAPRVRGFSDLHFPDAEAMRTRYFDSDRGREEIVHDLGHFIAGGLQRVFTREYVFQAPAP